MKASWNWIRALLPELSSSSTDVAARLTQAGLEVEAMHAFGQGLETVVLAQVQKLDPHPTRGSLRLVTVEVGGAAPQQIVCGAPNVPAPGGWVVMAPVGTHLPAKNLTLAPRDIGGVRSEGMLCSEVELGLGHDESGLWLPTPEPSFAPGTPLPRAIPSVTDTIFEIGLTPNRADALSHLGLARELAALYETRLQLPVAPPLPASDRTNPLQVSVEAAERCPLYSALVLADVALAPSPAWLRHRLVSLGVRALSNVVDVTNYLMLLYGQPLHAFDLRKLRGGALHVRQARAGETLTTLDGQVRSLHVDDLVIADAERPTALAGVMGGQESEIGPTTSELALECAWFDPRSVRRTARRHGLATEASHRYERGLHGIAYRDVVAHAVHLLTEQGGGQLVGDLVVIQSASVAPAPATLRPARARALLGKALPDETMMSCLTRLGCEVRSTEREGTSVFHVTCPPWRGDVRREVDLIEEIARLYGLDHIEATLPALRPQPPRRTGRLEAKVRAAAVGLGLREALTYAFVSPRELEALGAPSAAVRVVNPLSEERSQMRTTLLPGLLEALGRAQRYGERGCRFFAAGNVFFAADGPASLPREQRTFAALLAGPRPAYLSRPEPYDVFDAKGIALELVARATRYEARLEPWAEDQRPAHLHPRAAAQVWVGSHHLGTLGQLHPDVLDALQLEGPAVVVEINLAELELLPEHVPQARVLPRVPPVTRDVALVVPETLAAHAVESMIREAAAPLCEHVEIFDVFHGGALPPHHRSLAFHVVYRDPKARSVPSEARTLTDTEVDACHQTMVRVVQERLGVALRA